MNFIKTYLLPILLLVFFSGQAIAQAELRKDSLINEQVFSKADTILANTYMSERDYNERYGINYLNEDTYDETFYGDEIYNEEPLRKNRRKNHFWDAVAVEIVAEMVVNTVFIIAAFWH